MILGLNRSCFCGYYRHLNKGLLRQVSKLTFVVFLSRLPLYRIGKIYQTTSMFCIYAFTSAPFSGRYSVKKENFEKKNT
jgi:hypothetical protein